METEELQQQDGNHRMEEHLTLSFVIRRGSLLEVSLPASATVRELGERLQVETGIAPHTLRLLVPHKKGAASSALLPFSFDHGSLLISRLGVTQGRPIRVMGALPEEIEELSQKAGDSYGRLIPGFSEEERKAKQRMAIGPSGAAKLPQGSYIFCDFRTLQLPGFVLYPPAEKALEIMHKLASDPGIVAIMNKHRWRVGFMTEMAPIGYVGISPKCILGYNKNHGEEISLRLRTDDLKGFRKYASIKKTLLHELAHMVHSEHDANFHALDKQLNDEAIALDWTKAQSHTLAGSRHLNDEDITDAGGVMTTSKSLLGHKVGGSKEHQQLGARSAAGLAALHRFSSDIERTEGEDMETEIDVIAEGNEAHIGTGHSTFSQREPDPDAENQMLEPGCIAVNGMEIHGVGNLHATVADGSLRSQVPKVEGVVDVYKEEKHDYDDVGKEEVGNELDFDSSKEWKNSEAMIAEPSSNVADLMMPEKHIFDTDLMINGRIASSLSSVSASSKLDGGANEGLTIASHDYVTEDLGLKSLQDHAEMVCKRVHAAISTLKSEATPSEAAISIQTLSNILRNLKEHPNEVKYKRLRKTNPAFQRKVAKFKGALEVLQAVGFSDGPSNDSGENDCLVLARDDPVLIWLAQTTLEECMA